MSDFDSDLGKSKFLQTHRKDVHAVYAAAYGAELSGAREREYKYDDDPDIQKLEVDYILTFADGKRFTVEEKVRFFSHDRFFSDILIEVSHHSAGEPVEGWIYRSKADWLGYFLNYDGRLDTEKSCVVRMPVIRKLTDEYTGSDAFHNCRCFTEALNGTIRSCRVCGSFYGTTESGGYVTRNISISRSAVNALNGFDLRESIKQTRFSIREFE